MLEADAGEDRFAPPRETVLEASGRNTFQRAPDSPSSESAMLCSSVSFGKSVMIW